MESTNNGDNSKSLEYRIQAESEAFSKILGSRLKTRIMMMLRIYSELSLTQLSKKMGKVKSTISKHMKELIELGLVNQEERPARGNIDQIVYSAALIGFKGKTYDELKGDNSKEIFTYLQEEFQINRRLFSYILEVNQQLLPYIADFYDKEPSDITDEFIHETYRYDTCIPRFRFMTKEEYLQYRKEYIEWENKFIRQMELKRLKESIEKPKEFMVINELIPIRKILDYVLKGKKNKHKA